MKISEMKIGQNVSERMYVADVSLRKTKGNPPSDFLSLSITDGEDTLDGKIWNYRASAQLPEANKLYNIKGIIGEFGGKKQITITAMLLSDDQDMSDFQCTFFKDKDTLWNEVMDAISLIDNEALHKIVLDLYTNNKQALLAGTAAKAVHHVGTGGLLVHTLEVYKHASNIAKELISENVPVSLDLARAGALVHDIGKINTYSITGPAVDMTQEGMLQEHISTGIIILKELGFNYQGVFENQIRLLMHIVASHHGKLEYGSPVTPAFMEAYIVNIADGISANIEILNAANKKAIIEGKELTDKIFALSNHEHLLQTTVAAMLGQ